MGFASSRGSVRHRAVPPWAIEQLGACLPLHVSVYPICATCPNESWLSGKRKKKVKLLFDVEKVFLVALSIVHSACIVSGKRKSFHSRHGVQEDKLFNVC